MIKRELFFEKEATDEVIAEAYDALRAERDSGKVGYYLLPESDMLAKIEAFIDDYDFEAKGIQNIVVIGIGGSSLGTKAVDSLLAHTPSRNGRKLIFMENVDPVEIESNLKDLVYEESFFIMISKSGSTIETTSHVKDLIHRFDAPVESEKFRSHFAFITDAGSPLDELGKTVKVPTFHIPHNVGGRFSVLSAVGLLPLTLLGYDTRALLAGAGALQNGFFDKSEDLLVQKAYHYATHSKDVPINVLFSYSSAFKEFNAWYVQLWGESLGKIDKAGNHVGMTPVGIIGSVDQHSFLQLLIEGPRDKTVTMIKVIDFQTPTVIPNVSLPHLEKTDYINGHTFNELINAQCDATMESIMQQGISVDKIEIGKLDEYNTGYMIMYYELLTSLCGHFLGVDTYDQPGVELGKQILKGKFAG
ncbi:MAG: glucose-6-phosphate isomerase [Sulfurospirillum sp.]|nr:MAG: glucose-6-phosphate isomerase [Sulfurospirillum sp.]